MNTYRSLETIKAVQFTGDPIPDVTCHGTPEQVQANGCDSSRKLHPHVHTQATGGMTILKPGDWIYPVPGGPFAVASDAKFRAHWEVPAPEAAPAAPTFPESVPGPVDLAPATAPEVVTFPTPDFKGPVTIAPAGPSGPSTPSEK